MTAELNAIAEYLDEYLDVQQSLLDVMSAKLDVLAKRSPEEAMALDASEAELVERLKGCVERRQGLLSDRDINATGQPTLKALARAASQDDVDSKRYGAADDAGENLNLSQRFDEAERMNRELRMRSVTAWVLAQRSIVHWSQMLEIVASQGRDVPTYKRDRKLRSRGALMDREA